MQHFVYTGDQASPSARLKWVNDCLGCGSIAQLAINLRSLHEVIRWDALKRPAAPGPQGPFVETSKALEWCGEPLPEKAVNKRDRYGLQYLVQFYGGAEREWWQIEKVSERALWMLAEYESEARRDAKKMWWKSVLLLF